MAVNADTDLLFSDGSLRVNSTVLRMASPTVLSNALEAHTACSSSGDSSSSSSAGPIPISGLTTKEWLEMAAFVYPVTPCPKISSLAQAEQLLEHARKFDIQRVVHEVDSYLAAAAKDMNNRSNIWKFLRLADEAGLELSLEALAEQAVIMDSDHCGQEQKLEGLTHKALVLIIGGFVKGNRYCWCCSSVKATSVTCDKCKRTL